MANVKVHGLSFSYEDNPIFKDIHINIEKGKLVGVVGPNGCGKSTLLKNIYNHFTPSSGAVYIAGDNVETLKPRQLAKRLSVVMQESNHQFDFSVLEMVLMGRYAYKKTLENDSVEDWELSRSALKKVGLKGFEDRRFLSLSGGEKQRVLIARAIAQNAEVIVLDEPTNHLDIKYQLQIMKVLQELNITSFAAIHDVNIAAQFCDEIYVLNSGRIYDSGMPEKVFNPEMFNTVFGVQAHVNKDVHTNQLHISFQLA